MPISRELSIDPWTFGTFSDCTRRRSRRPSYVPSASGCDHDHYRREQTGAFRRCSPLPTLDRSRTTIPRVRRTITPDKSTREILDRLEVHAPVPIMCGAAIHSRPFSIACQ
jgi:hypothetical protein